MNSFHQLIDFDFQILISIMTSSPHLGEAVKVEKSVITITNFDQNCSL